MTDILNPVDMTNKDNSKDALYIERRRGFAKAVPVTHYGCT